MYTTKITHWRCHAWSAARRRHFSRQKKKRFPRNLYANMQSAVNKFMLRQTCCGAGSCPAQRPASPAPTLRPAFCSAFLLLFCSLPPFSQQPSGQRKFFFFFSAHLPQRESPRALGGLWVEILGFLGKKSLEDRWRIALVCFSLVFLATFRRLLASARPL